MRMLTSLPVELKKGETAMAGGDAMRLAAVRAPSKPPSHCAICLPSLDLCTFQTAAICQSRLRFHVFSKVPKRN